MIANGGTVGLAEGIIDETCLVFLTKSKTSTKSFTGNVIHSSCLIFQCPLKSIMPLPTKRLKRPSAKFCICMLF